MKFSNQAQYAVTLMEELARQRGDSYLPLSHVAKENHISYSFLRKIAALLKAKNFVIAEEGLGGGYRLTRSAETISLGEILRAIDEPIVDEPCCDNQGANHQCQKSVCPFCGALYNFQKVVEETFGKVTLDKLAKGELSCVKLLKKS